MPGSQRLDGPLVGRLSLNEDPAMALAETMDSIEARPAACSAASPPPRTVVPSDRRGPQADSEYVQLLNFAYLSIDQRKVLGQGGTARVYASGRTRRSRPRWSAAPTHRAPPPPHYPRRAHRAHPTPCDPCEAAASTAGLPTRAHP